MHKCSFLSKNFNRWRLFALGIGILFPLHTLSAHASDISSNSNITILSYSGGVLENGIFYAGEDAGCQVAFSCSETLSANSIPSILSYSIGNTKYSVSVTTSKTHLPLQSNQCGPLTITYNDGSSQVSRTMEYILSENGAPVISVADSVSSNNGVISFNIEDIASNGGTILSGISEYHCYVDEQPFDCFTTEELNTFTLETGVSVPSLIRLTLTLPDSDTHCIRITATDKCGNTGEYSTTIEDTENTSVPIDETDMEEDSSEASATEDATGEETMEETTEEVTTEETTSEETTSEEDDTEGTTEEDLEIITVLLPTDFTILMYKIPNQSTTIVESQDIPFINIGDQPVKVNITGIHFNTNDAISGSNVHNLSVTLKQYNNENQSFSISEDDEDIFYSITLAPKASDTSSLLDRASRWNPLGDVTSGDYATLRLIGNLGEGNWTANDVSVNIVYELKSVEENTE